MRSIPVHRHTTKLWPESARVIVRPYMPASPRVIGSIVDRALALAEEDVEAELRDLRREFGPRHFDIEAPLLEQYARVQSHLPTQCSISPARQLLIGALFSGEYALESAALFNPSIVPHPDQDQLPSGALRFIMSLRATGEGHVSSIEFRVGVISREGDIDLTPASRFVTVPEVVPNPTYSKKDFVIKLHEMGFDNDCVTSVMSPLPANFARSELCTSIARLEGDVLHRTQDFHRTLECIQWLADSNYELRFSSNLALSERIIFPVSANESNGIEDARFVRFTDEDGSVMYYATYTAYNGYDILPQLIETKDFLHFRVLTLNGGAVQNKGMALFPRKILGRYTMLSRQDDENILIMSSDNPHYWSDPEILLRPAEVWESGKVGNCGAPIETHAGWLVITHGMGPMRKYCIGAALLDLGDPRTVIGRLSEPLLAPVDDERDGYVPNVVYSCGSLVHGGKLILPYAMSDRTTAIASVDMEELLSALWSSNNSPESPLRVSE